MRVLGIETSCDETSAAIVCDGNGTGRAKILSNRVFSQIAEHMPYQGVVPEIAARAHLHHLRGLVDEACSEAAMELAEVDAIAVTAGPGLIGGLMVGLMVAKGMAAVLDKPLVAVNHLEGHALTARLTNDVPFPFLLLLVSGGHCQVVAVEGVGHYSVLGTTMDDAVGEAFDKVAKMLSLGYPGGPAVERLAREGDPRAFDFPISLRGRAGCDFSFSGLKTAVRKVVMEQPNATPADICASFQRTVGDIFEDRLHHACTDFTQRFPAARHFVVAGGVAANQYLRGRLQDITARYQLELVAPPPALCTDNGAMIAWAGLERFRLGQRDGLEAAPRARWPLDSA